MTTLNCIVCNCILDDAAGGMAENQPYEGTSFTSYGHYGSTVFDPMDGSFIEINVCDRCLTKAGKKQQVLEGRSSEPVRMALPLGSGENERLYWSIVGHHKVRDQPLVFWHKGIASYERKLDLDREDLDIPERLKNIEFSVPIESLKSEIDDYDSRHEIPEIAGTNTLDSAQ